MRSQIPKIELIILLERIRIFYQILIGYYIQILCHKINQICILSEIDYKRNTKLSINTKKILSHLLINSHLLKREQQGKNL